MKFHSTLSFFSSLPDNYNSAQSSSPACVGVDEGSDTATESAAAVDKCVFLSGRRITRSQQVAANSTAKIYPLRQSRSSGSDTEANGKVSCVFCMHQNVSEVHVHCYVYVSNTIFGFV